MLNLIVFLLKIGLTFYIISLFLSLTGTVGIILGIIVIVLFIIPAIMWVIFKSHDKRFKQIILKSIENNKKTSGKEFGIKPIKFKYELENTRYDHSNYLQKDDEKIIIKHYYLDEDYSVYCIEIVNKDNIAEFTTTLIDEDTLEKEYKEELYVKEENDKKEKEKKEMTNQLDSLIHSLNKNNSKKK